MKELLTMYFAAEKRDAILALIAGLLALIGSAWLVATRHPFRGAAIPLALIALVEIAVGVSYLNHQVHLVPTLLDQLETSPAVLMTELARMRLALRNYRITVVIEALVLLGSVVVALASRRDFTFAVAIGCIVQAAPLLIADTLGTRRASVYLEALQQQA